jgi:hypothetical protein
LKIGENGLEMFINEKKLSGRKTEM